MYFNHAYQKTLINTNDFYSTTKNTVSTIGVPTAQVAVIASLTTSAYTANTVVDTSI